MDSRRIKTALVVIFSVFAVTTLLALAQPTATKLYVEDASGYKNTTISLPVNIVDTQNGVAGIEFELVYNKSVLNLTQIRKGDLFDDSSSMLDKKGEQGDYTILVTGYSLTDGSNGSIVVCDFSITGEPGETSLVNLSNINLYNKMGETGTASANNGTFTVLTPLAPNINSFVPLSPVEDIVGSRRVFNLSVNQTVNVSWRINGTEVQTNTSVTESSYTNASAVIGTWNVSAIVMNQNGTDIQTWIWYVPVPPNVTSFAPANTTPSQDEGTTNTFNVTIDQVVSNAWYLNGNQQPETSQSFTHTWTYTDAGVHNITYVSVNVNGTAIKTWMVTVIDIYGSISGIITNTCNETGIAGVAVNLTQNGTSINSTVTDSSGSYTFTDIPLDTYNVTASKIRFWSNSTSVTVNSGACIITNLTLWLKGDLNNNGISADGGDGGDVTAMWSAWRGEITPDYRFDLNNNDELADGGDVTAILSAWRGEIILE
ncbi:MAG: Carboxypeptidase regulatory-like domain protein [Candidatus Argoarchaeum ethanivorans]|uniref:Carboxypeptidase regulatory-like domain protein n=1 Tax=Candidatus Argoarchaeum ethanivorans TaxID=2608793 RepID=A0A811T9D2_9EURY|nr:MAG: Carboxypeptidase regulatory-like domain protein [Candidatus Argoarchaeum ethanivorans]